MFPDPNVNAEESVQAALGGLGYNYLTNRRNDIDSDQYDLRVDQNFGARGTAFARYTNKSIDQVNPGQLALPNGSSFARYSIFAAAFSTMPSHHRLNNEFRFGFTLEEDGNSNQFDGAALTNAANFSGISRSFPFNGIPYLGFDQLTTVGGRLNSTERSRIFQYVDNLTLQRGTHTVRIGTDLRHLTAFTPLSFAPADNYGNFAFHVANSFTGQEFADFLIGAPQLSQTDNVTHDNNGSANAYAVYVQDNWKTTPNLNLTFGLRYELHPAFATSNGTLGNFDPSVPKSGRIIYNAGQAAGLSVQELASVNACITAGVNNPYANNLPVNGAPCTPVLSNVKAGLPSGLRTLPKLRFEPRVGFAYRPFGNDRTAIRGGAGYYNITTTGALFYALTGTVSANLQSFYNSETASGPAFVFPNVSLAGILLRRARARWFFTRPWILSGTIRIRCRPTFQSTRILGMASGCEPRISVSRPGILVWQAENNMLPYSSTTPATSQPRSAFNFPNFASIPVRSSSAQATYHAGQVELSHRISHGLSLNSAYTLAKNLADNQGTYGAAGASQSFVDEQGGYNATYTYDRHLDYGNVTGTRRHRFLSSGIYELPVGRGKLVGASMNRFAELALGEWQVSGIFLLQSGPFLTPFIPGGTAGSFRDRFGVAVLSQQRPDRLGNGNLRRHTRQQWFNNDAFACPGSIGFSSLQNNSCIVGGVDGNGVAHAPIGRFGTSSVGDVTGPGTASLSMGLSKSFLVAEGVRLRAEGTFTNVLNHTNLADPILDTTSPAFGTITQARGSDFGGNRTGQISVKLDF